MHVTHLVHKTFKGMGRSELQVEIEHEIKFFAREVLANQMDSLCSSTKLGQRASKKLGLGQFTF